jgi:hypothetical protein
MGNNVLFFTDDIKFITLAGNKRVLMANKYTYAQTTPRHFYCSKKSKGCKARIFLNQDETEVVFSFVHHDHNPPVYVQTSSGVFERIVS